MLTMHHIQDLDALFAQDRGFPDRQAYQLEYEVRHGLEPTYTAYLNYIVEFSCENDSWYDVADYIRISLNHLASGGTIYGKTASFHYINGRIDNPLNLMPLSRATIKIGGVPVGYTTITSFNVASHIDKGSMPDIDHDYSNCQHEPVQMVFTSFCKKCNKTLT